MPKIFRVHTAFTPSARSLRLFAGDYLLENIQPDNGDIRVISQNKEDSVYVYKGDVERYGALMEVGFPPIACQNHTIREVAQLLRESVEGASFSNESALHLAAWLDELDDSREAIQLAREALSKARR